MNVHGTEEEEEEEERVEGKGRGKQLQQQQQTMKNNKTRLMVRTVMMTMMISIRPILNKPKTFTNKGKR